MANTKVIKCKCPTCGKIYKRKIRNWIGKIPAPKICDICLKNNCNYFEEECPVLFDLENKYPFILINKEGICI